MEKLEVSASVFRRKAAGNDYLEGNFYGVDNSEAYGVFDTDNFTGAFGTKREGEL